MRRTTALTALLMTLSSPALAAGGGFVMEVHGYYIVDFIVFVGALYYFLKKPLASFLENRRAAAAKEMDEAAEIKSKAEERLARYDKQLASLDETREELNKEFTRDGEVEKTRALDDAKATSERLQREQERSLQQEAAKLAGGLETELATRALELAEEKIATKLTPGVHQALVAQFIADLGRIDSLDDFRKAEG